jgi:hypothetical protein
LPRAPAINRSPIRRTPTIRNFEIARGLTMVAGGDIGRDIPRIGGIARKKQMEIKDNRGRVLSIEGLRPSQQMAIIALTRDLDGTIEANGFDVPIRYQVMLAAMVRAIDGVPVALPSTRETLDALLDNLGEPGIIAAAEALAEMLKTRH